MRRRRPCRIAETVAATIKHWLDSGEIIEGTGKRLTPGDVMVLVRKRDRFVHALSRSLKEKRIAVAGADRLSLPAHIAVKDMIALGRFLLQPEDDLSLAAVLRSPIFGADRGHAVRTRGQAAERHSLAESLRRQAPDDLFLAEIVARLDAWANEAAFKPVFEFYSGVLGRDRVRQRMIARLGHEAGDILDEFLNFCLAEERAGLPGLEAFLATLESAGPEIKREMDQGRDEVRIMTVHAAKGLEAPVCFPGRRRHGAVQRAASAAADAVHHDRRRQGLSLALDQGGRQRLFPHCRGAREGARGRRIPPAALCRHDPRRGPADRLRLPWQARAQSDERGTRSSSARLLGIPETEERLHPVTGEAVHRYRSKIQPPVAADVPDAATCRAAACAASAFKPLPPEDDLPRPLSPSGASVLIEDAREPVVSGRSPVLDGEEEPGIAVARGSAIHKLLQVLPDMPQESARDRRPSLSRPGCSGLV